MVVNQGDVHWVDLGEPIGSAPGYSHPNVVIPNDMFNHSRLNTVVICALTSNLGRANVPGNVLLDQGEASLPRKSVVVVSQIYSVDKTQLGEYIGALSKRRVRQILDGIRLITEPHDSPR